MPGNDIKVISKLPKQRIHTLSIIATMLLCTTALA